MKYYTALFDGEPASLNYCPRCKIEELRVMNTKRYRDFYQEHSELIDHFLTSEQNYDEVKDVLKPLIGDERLQKSGYRICKFEYFGEFAKFYLQSCGPWRSPAFAQIEIESEPTDHGKWGCHLPHNTSYTLGKKRYLNMKFLEELGTDSDSIDRHGVVFMHSACREGDKKLVKYLIDNGVDLNAKVEENGQDAVAKYTYIRSFAEIAARNDYWEIVFMLLENGAEDPSGAIRHALKDSNFDLAMKLSKYASGHDGGIDQDIVDNMFYNVIADNDLYLLRKLVAEGLKPSRNTLKYFYNVKMTGYWSRSILSLEMFKEIYKLGIKIDHILDESFERFMEECEFATIDFMIEIGFFERNDPQNCLFVCANKNRLDVLEEIIEYIDIEENYDAVKSAFLEACMDGSSDDVAKFLVDNGINFSDSSFNKEIIDNCIEGLSNYANEPTEMFPFLVKRGLKLKTNHLSRILESDKKIFKNTIHAMDKNNSLIKLKIDNDFIQNLINSEIKISDILTIIYRQTNVSQLLDCLVENRDIPEHELNLFIKTRIENVRDEDDLACITKLAKWFEN